MESTALPGLDGDRASVPGKTGTGYLLHLAQLLYGDSWTFWSLTSTNDPPIAAERRRHRAEDVETVWLVRGHQLRLALIRIRDGHRLAHTDLLGGA